jgi:hypothetical protein
MLTLKVLDYKPSKLEEYDITTLFNLFCPFGLDFNLRFSVVSLFLISLIFINLFITLSPFFYKNTNKFMRELFPLVGTSLSFFVVGFLFLRRANLVSLVSFSYPTTTTLVFNLRAAFIL